MSHRKSSIQLINEDEDLDEMPEIVVLTLHKIGFIIRKIFEEEGSGNVVLSPLGTSILLGMACLGADQNTLKQLRRTFCSDISYASERINHKGIKFLLQGITKDSFQCEDHGGINIINVVFHQSGTDVLEKFVHELETYYHGNVVDLKMSGDPAKSITIMNNWIKKKTSYVINNLWNKPLSPTNVSILLANVVYFKGKWKIEFPQVRTFNRNFFLHGNQSRKVKMMNLVNEEFLYLEDKILGYKFLELPYQGGKLCMLFAVSIHGMKTDLVMNYELLNRLESEMVNTELDQVSIPKFKLVQENNLKHTIWNSGVNDAFMPDFANFKKMSSKPHLHISDIIQKVIIEVDEHGGQKARLSGLQIFPVLSGVEILDFVLDRPFLFYVVDKTTKTVILYGKVLDITD